MSNNESVKNNARINTLVEKLRSKLRNFVVMDRQGELMGEVKDLILDTNRQLNLVVSQLANNQNRSFLLISKLIQKIDPPNKSVLVDINKAEIEHLPEYVNKQAQGMEIPENPLVTPAHEAADSLTPTPELELQNIQEQVDNASLVKSSDIPEVLEEEIIRLLGERLVVGRSKRKVGEVIVRKEIETRMVQVPVRREKLIVEQVSPERKQLAEIDLGEQEIAASALTQEEIAGLTQPQTTSLDNGLTVKGEFTSAKIASLLLNAIALERRQGYKKIRVEIVAEDAERQKTYQEWFDRSSGRKQS